MKKAFTLIELLAVIIVLGIIALIAVPKVVDIISEAKDKANRVTAQEYIKGIDDKLSIKSLKDEIILPGYYPIDILVNELGIEKNNQITGIIKISDKNKIEDVSLLIGDKTNFIINDGIVLKDDKLYNKYNVGDEVTINEEKFYVIEDSNENNPLVKLFSQKAIATNDNINFFQSDSPLLINFVWNNEYFWPNIAGNIEIITRNLNHKVIYYSYLYGENIGGYGRPIYIDEYNYLRSLGFDNITNVAQINYWTATVVDPSWGHDYKKWIYIINGLNETPASYQADYGSKSIRTVVLIDKDKLN